MTNDDSRQMLLDAIDSHIYWQLSDREYRDSGFVRDPGSNDSEAAAEIQRFRELAVQIEAGEIAITEKSV